jgi:DNA-binding PadR family transcriptional regulator
VRSHHPGGGRHQHPRAGRHRDGIDHDDREFGRHRRRLFESGDFRVLLLSLLAEEPRHGYELIRLIEQMFGGTYAPSPGIVYPTLTLLEEQELAAVQATEGEARKRYAITAQGRRWLEQHADAVAGLRARIAIDAKAMKGSAVPESVRQAIRTLKHALNLDQRAWPEVRTQRVLNAIEQATAAVDAAERG